MKQVGRIISLTSQHESDLGREQRKLMVQEIELTARVRESEFTRNQYMIKLKEVEKDNVEKNKKLSRLEEAVSFLSVITGYYTFY